MNKIHDYTGSKDKDKILIGPILGIENSDQGGLKYTICFLLNDKSKSTPQLFLEYSDNEQEIQEVLPCSEIRLKLNLGSNSGFRELYNEIEEYKKIKGFKFYRTEIDSLQASTELKISYSLERGRDKLKTIWGSDSWSFLVPAKGDFGKIAYVSCNGWTDKRPPKSVYALWEDLFEKQTGFQEDEDPYNLLLMGGDQIYSDSFTYKTVADPDDYEADNLDKKFLQQYFQSFSLNQYASEILASIPSVMMWDDHDICDGWGSYNEGFWTKFQCEIGMQEVFKAAIKYFCFFQLRGGPGYNQNLLDDDFTINIDSKYGFLKNHFSLSFNWTQDTCFIAMDLRSNRTPGQVCNSKNYRHIKEAIAQNSQKVFIMSSIPMAYLQYGSAMTTLASLFIDSWNSRENELSDDMMDHWHHSHHIGEFETFIQSTRDLLKRRNVVILSGDVHHAGISRINFKESPDRYLQLISSGIIHPSDDRLKKALSLAGLDDRVSSWFKSKLNLGDFSIELLDHICWSNLNPDLNEEEINGKQWTSFNRNYLSLHLDSNNPNELWANWYEECNGSIHKSPRLCSL